VARAGTDIRGAVIKRTRTGIGRECNPTRAGGPKFPQIRAGTRDGAHGRPGLVTGALRELEPTAVYRQIHVGLPGSCWRSQHNPATHRTDSSDQRLAVRAPPTPGTSRWRPGVPYAAAATSRHEIPAAPAMEKR
jgi:hypothetical protein